MRVWQEENYTNTREINIYKKIIIGHSDIFKFTAMEWIHSSDNAIKCNLFLNLIPILKHGDFYSDDAELFYLASNIVI